MLSRLHQIIQQRRNRKNLYSTAAYWDSKADSYDDTSVPSMWPNQALNHLYENEQKELIICTTWEEFQEKCYSILAAALGVFLAGSLSQGAQVTGVDFSAGALAIAAKQSSGENPNYHEGSVFELSDEDAYDVVFTCRVF